ncbi:MAG: hypothetical protein CFK52_08835 [Chloracidobacterium sp. CP2_5A]|nr:MAG: hypothetical protein CFK52_08835 [Chloracidobacterium sp. CP2_5A]
MAFVCIENSCRNQLAEALARLHNPGDFEIYSAGSRPSGKVPEKAIAKRPPPLFAAALAL